MKREARYRSTGMGFVLLMMLVSYQNCGQAASSGAANLPTDGSVHVAPSTQDPAEVQILSQVLNSYTVCNQISDSSSRLTCEHNALQTNSIPASQTPIAAANLVCYVVGPQCLVPDTDGSYNSLMRLQACRTDMVNNQGYTFESLNTYMQTDPVGYAAQVNSACLYKNSQCVVAVRCIDSSAIPSDDSSGLSTGVSTVSGQAQ